MKFTKIVATINASRCTPDLLLALYKNGMDVVRFNTAHMEVEEMDRAVEMVRQVSAGIAILVDTKGPNIRTCNLETPLELKQGDTVYVTGTDAGRAQVPGEACHKGLRLGEGQRLVPPDTGEGARLLCDRVVPEGRDVGQAHAGGFREAGRETCLVRSCVTHHAS